MSEGTMEIFTVDDMDLTRGSAMNVEIWAIDRLFDVVLRSVGCINDCDYHGVFRKFDYYIHSSSTGLHSICEWDF